MQMLMFPILYSVNCSSLNLPRVYYIWTLMVPLAKKSEDLLNINSYGRFKKEIRRSPH